MTEEEKTEEQGATGAGRLLREERERKGLTHEDVAERTRLRPNIIRAIEGEEWASLPSPAFLRGFLRNYAKVLSMDETRVLEAYGRKISVGGQLLRSPGEPLGRRRKGPFFLLCVVCAVAVFVLWKTYGPRETELSVHQEVSPPVIAEAEKGPERVPDAVAAPEKRVEVAGVEVAGVPPFSAPETQEQPEPPAPKPAAAAPAAAPEPEPQGPHTLKGKVNLRTWVKIYVDDLNPREYMFQPGQQPEWTASRGFYLIIGNAGGIDLEWNGRVVPALGNPGQVVRLSLPEEFRRRLEGN